MLFYLRKNHKNLWHFYQDPSLGDCPVKNDWPIEDDFYLHYICKNGEFIGNCGLGQNSDLSNSCIFNSERHIFQQLRKRVKNLHIHQPKIKSSRTMIGSIMEIWQGDLI